MKPKAWCPAGPIPFGRESIFPTPTVPKQSTPAAQSLYSRSFDVLHVLAQLFNLRFDFQREPRDFQGFALDAGSFREQRVGFALHFLEKKIQLFSKLSRAIQQF